jgi:hypothetical protein
LTQAVTPTHRVPYDGLPAWTDADASTAPAATLDPGLEVQVLTRWGDWAYIRCANNWSAWVDGRRLHPMVSSTVSVTGQAAATPPAAAYENPSAAAAPIPRTSHSGHSGAPSVNVGGRNIPITPALGGALVVVVGSLLDWVKDAGNSFDVRLMFLFSRSSTAMSGLRLGHVVLIAAAAAVAFAVARPEGREVKVIGTAIGGLTLLFVVQLQRSLSDFGNSDVGLTTVLGAGVYITGIGALLMPLRMPRSAGRG